VEATKPARTWKHFVELASGIEQNKRQCRDNWKFKISDVVDDDEE